MNCPNENYPPKAQWCINEIKAENSHFGESTGKRSTNSSQTHDRNNDDQNNNADTVLANQERNVGWAGVNINLSKFALQFYQKCNLRNWILLDAQSTTTMHCNKNFVPKRVLNATDTIVISCLDSW